MCSSYVVKSSILPQLIPIPDFNVRESFIVVVLQSMKKETLIMSKIICPTIITSVTVAKENEFG
jgi:hypothetical protein